MCVAMHAASTGDIFILDLVSLTLFKVIQKIEKE